MTYNALARIPKASVLSCLQCRLCLNLVHEATTISECLHTFCKDCIYQHLEDEENDCCPACNASLGCTPLEKLRADHQLDDVCGKLFPIVIKKKRKVIDMNVDCDGRPLVKRKERSLLSLGIGAASSPGFAVRETRAVSRLQPAPSSERTSKHDIHRENFNSERGKWDGVILGGPTQARDSLRDNDTKAEEVYRCVSVNVSDTNDFSCQKACGGKVSINNLEDSDMEVMSMNGKSRHGKRIPPMVKLSVTGKQKDYANATTTTIKSAGFWFILQAANQSGNNALPQIASQYLRIKDGKLTMSVIKKYLVKKLGLRSESEVEITIRGQHVVANLSLENVRCIWFSSMPSPLLKGTHPQDRCFKPDDYMMVLNYGRHQ